MAKSDMRTVRNKRPAMDTVTMADVARLAGVSAQTVSRVLSQPDIVTEDTRRAVESAVAELNYIPNGAARFLASRGSRIIALIIPNLASSVYASQVSRMVGMFEQRGLSVLIGNTDYSMEREEKLLQSFLERRPQGIVITGTQHSARSTALMKQSGIPIVETWDVETPPIDMAVGFSNRSAGAMVGDLMARRGCRIVGFVGGQFDQDPRAYQRYLGLQDAFARHGLEIAAVHQIAMPLKSLDGIAGLDAIYTAAPLVDGIFFSADSLAMAAILECNRRGIRVPDQLAICGFGDYELSSLLSPSLTTVRVPTATLGERAAQMILDRIDGKHEGPHTQDITVELIRRGSC